MGFFNNFFQVAAAVPATVDEMIETTCQHLEQGFRVAIIANSQVDTGNMRDSSYRVTAAGSTYVDTALNTPPPPLEENTGYAGVAANYAGYQNYGTRYLPARPFFEPVIEREQSVMPVTIEIAIQRLEAAAQ